MARLNEPPPPVSTDSMETLRRKLFRQNRDLAKSNNIRALRIRELENQCALMLSENLELRGKILDLEAQVEDNEARRIADHALAIKDKLEAQLTEWGTMLAGLGLEPPPKRHSPRARKSIVKQRMSFHSNRPSPSQRRLRDIASHIEDLGHIPENKAYARQSLNPQQIQALREADEQDEDAQSPELGPPPSSAFIDQDPVKVDSPMRTPEPSPPQKKMQAPILLNLQKSPERPPPSPEKKDATTPELVIPKHMGITPSNTETRTADTPLAMPIKAGIKRKHAAKDVIEAPIEQQQKENKPVRAMAIKGSVLGKAEGKTLKQLASIRKEARGDNMTEAAARKPLSAKSTNDDVNSPKKMKAAPKDEIAAMKAEGKGQINSPKKAKESARPEKKTKSTQDRPKVKSKPKHPIVVEIPLAEPAAKQPPVAELSVPVAEPALLSPASPNPAPSAGEAGRGGDTPPPADISSAGETTRPSRRNRTAVSYAEPSLNSKMRRPSEKLFDAVGTDSFSRRSSTHLLPGRTSMSEVSSKSRHSSMGGMTEEVAPASPLAAKSVSKNLDGTNQKRSRTSSVAKEQKVEPPKERAESPKADKSSSFNSDVYNFTDSSPQVPEKVEQKPRPARRPSRVSTARKFAEALESDDEESSSSSSRVSSQARDDDFQPKAASSRRRSTMV